MTSPLDVLSHHGVSVWLDDLSRDRLTNGGLSELVSTRRVVGVTTNPSIFQAAITGSNAYAEQVAALAAGGADADAIVHALTVEDVRAASDLLAPVAEATAGLDGKVSIEVDPRLARDTEGTLDQARMLWQEIDRPNLLVKIPATVEGLPAIRAAVAEGISVNVTLIFSIDRYRDVIEAYLAGLEDRQSRGLSVGGVASVASFFVSRVDTAVDAQLDAVGSPSELRGQAAIANARLAYRVFEELFAGPRWEALQRAGARPQRPLWASTGVKDPRYADTMYVTELVAPGTVNTMPESTLHAVADHGAVSGDTVRDRYDQAEGVLAALASQGIDLAEVTHALEREGVDKFVAAWQQLLDSVADRAQEWAW